MNTLLSPPRRLPRLATAWALAAMVPVAAAHADEPPAAGRVQLSPEHLVLPEAPADASPRRAQFVAAARRAVQAVYLQDTDDASELVHRAAELAGDPELATLRPAWADILAAARARADTLAALAPALVTLRAGTARAWMDPAGHALHHVSPGACGRAFAAGPALSPAAASVVVGLGHLGRRSLGEWRTLCEDNRQRALGGRELPGRRASARLEAWAQRQYAAAHLAGRLVRLHLIHGRPRRGHPTEVVAGVVRAAEPGEEPCAMVTMRAIVGRAASLRPLGPAVPLLCRSLVLPKALR